MMRIITVHKILNFLFSCADIQCLKNRPTDEIPYFEQMVGQIYPSKLHLNKAISFYTEAPFLDLNLSITNGIVSSKIYGKRDDFNFEIANFPFLNGDVPRFP